MPAAAVIPAPIAYIKVVAVKTFVVELVLHTGSTTIIVVCTVPYVCKRITGGVLICIKYLYLCIFLLLKPASVLFIECCCGPVQLL